MPIFLEFSFYSRHYGVCSVCQETFHVSPSFVEHNEYNGNKQTVTKNILSFLLQRRKISSALFIESDRDLIRIRERKKYRCSHFIFTHWGVNSGFAKWEQTSPPNFKTYANSTINIQTLKYWIYFQQFLLSLLISCIRACKSLLIASLGTKRNHFFATFLFENLFSMIKKIVLSPHVGHHFT